jgi:vacuolar-type H+-ATPase subunit F/Vma7
MKLAIHAVGRAQDVFPFLALGAEIHEVSSEREAADAVRSLAREAGTLVLLSEEFARAAEAGRSGLVFVAPGAGGSLHTAIDKTRELVSRSVGVDLIAKADRTGR